MDIIFATNNKFCKCASVAIVSLLENNPNTEITIHFFTIECEEKNVKIVADVVSTYSNVTFKVYSITDEILRNFPPTGIYSKACYLRVLAPSLLPTVDKVLYLDCDIVVNGDIRGLWNIDIERFAVAGVKDATLSFNIVKSYINFDYNEGYINSGVLLMNLTFWRKHDIEKKLIDFLNHNMVKLPDQDAINIVCHEYIKFINPKWNCHVGYFSFPPLVSSDQKKYHYCPKKFSHKVN